MPGPQTCARGPSRLPRPQAGVCWLAPRGVLAEQSSVHSVPWNAQPLPHPLWGPEIKWTSLGGRGRLHRVVGEAEPTRSRIQSAKCHHPPRLSSGDPRRVCHPGWGRAGFLREDSHAAQHSCIADSKCWSQQPFLPPSLTCEGASLSLSCPFGKMGAITMHLICFQCPAQCLAHNRP